ncbi:NADH-quinone oxidoreductase subunit NuoK [Fulvivirga sp. M361]|uniref:NADH-quinone oxidoreductase subunit NuoK n=1 Tax=Fulvivirga sp. M361 TaxID=2594266 RepID=UPI001179FB1A|nr:NADH-quinone oxidoreductase subunit NuoK [Fulvivirga sp. M361]TRX56090.1 NADH-quinone oxidoreductase subunit NuoK [Fulvivirga sp. M361]
MIPLEHFYFISAILFALGLAIVVTRRNAIFVLMGVELMLNAANINFVAISHGGKLEGQLFALFVIVVAAAEAAVGLAIILAVYRRFKTINLDKVNEITD